MNPSRDLCNRAIPNPQGRTMKPIMENWINTASVLITDKNPSYKKIGRSFACHHTVQHNKRQYANNQYGRGRECGCPACADWCLSPSGPEAPPAISGRDHLAMEPPRPGGQGADAEVCI